MSEELFYKKTGIRFTDYYTTHRERMVNFIRRKSGNFNDLDDIVNDAFHNLLKSIHRFDPNLGTLNTWAYTIVSNSACATYKKRPQWVDVMDDQGENHFVDTYIGLYDDYNQDYLDEVQETYNKLLKVIDNLEYKYKEILTLQMVEGFTMQEIVDLTGLSMSVVKNRLKQSKHLVNNKYRAKKW